MAQDIRVLIIEDDPYARDIIAMICSRDWRTRVVGEFGCRAEADVASFLADENSHVDVVIVDTESPENPDWPDRVTAMVASLARPPIVLYTCTYPHTQVLSKILTSGRGGYLAKGEVLYTLASAVVWAAKGYFVITPAVCEIVPENLALPEKTIVLNGSRPVANFTQRESDIVRLGILFNLAQRDIADELVISTNWVAETISNAYEKLELREILAGDVPLETYFDDPVLIERCRSIIGRGSGSKSCQSLQEESAAHHIPRKSPWISTLAFHLLTVPEIEQL